MLATSAAASTPPPIAMPTSACQRKELNVVGICAVQHTMGQPQHQFHERSHLCKCCSVISAVANHGYAAARALQLLYHGSLACGLDTGMHMLRINAHCCCDGFRRTLLIPCKDHVKLRHVAARAHCCATNMLLEQLTLA